MRHKNIHIIKGTKPVLISAPHTRPILIKEEGAAYTKAAEERMTEIIEHVCEKTGAWGICVKKQEARIHNWEKTLRDTYRRHLRHLISSHDLALFLEVHGSRASRPFIFDYDFLIPNLHPHDNILEDLITQNAKKYFPAHLISRGFFRPINGRGEKTMTYFVRDSFKMPAVQLEINRGARKNEQRFSYILSIIKETITQYHENHLNNQIGE